MDKYRIERLKVNGYNPIHLFGRWYLCRKYSKFYKGWIAKIPIYKLFYLNSENDLTIT